jgi:hypothetical protein
MNSVCLRAARSIALCCALAAPGGVASASEVCQQPGCTEVRTFTATVTSLRASKQGANRLVNLTVRFHNKTDKPLTLGYVSESGAILDDKGNRYDVSGANAVRGIGTVSGKDFDAKFTLEPKEASDARFELVWKNAGSTAAGTRFDLDLAVREIVPGSGDQMKLGAEHAIHYTAIDEPTITAASKGGAPAAAAATATAANAAVPATPAAVTDPCAAAKYCYNAGGFIAQVQQVTPTQYTPAGRHHSITMNIRFTNTSSAPIILGYRSSSSALVDNYGNRYFWGRSGTHDTSVQGIGYVTGRSADPQFTLNPGQSRMASFGVTRYNVNTPIGSTFKYDLVINELEILGAQQQVRSLRDNALSFTNLVAGSVAVAHVPGATGVPGQIAGEAAAGAAAGAVPATEADVANKMIDLFKSVTKKKEKTTP